MKGHGTTSASLSETERGDLALAAKTDGIAVHDLVRRAAGASEFREVTTRLATDYPDLFVTAGVASADGQQPAFITVKKLPEAIRSDIEALPIDVEVRTGATSSADELAAQSRALMGEVLDAIPSASTMQSQVDPQTQTIEITYEDDSTPVADSLARDTTALQSVRRFAVEHELPAVVSASPDVGIRLETAVKGGRTLRKDGDPYCTAGFTARRNGVDGLLTAKHCTRDLTYQDENGVIDWVAGASNIDSGWIDPQFQRTLTPHSTTKDFRADVGEDRTVLAAEKPNLGDPACHYGMGSGVKKCSSIESDNNCVWNGEHFICSLLQTVSQVSTGGDSGGPWFWGSTAYGVHFGSSTAGSLFTTITRVAANLDANVKIDN